MDDGQLSALMVRTMQLSKRTWQSIYAEHNRIDRIALVSRGAAQAIQSQTRVWATGTEGRTAAGHESVDCELDTESRGSKVDLKDPTS